MNDELELQTGQILSEYAIFEAKEKIKSLYAEKHYHSIRIDTVYTPNENEYTQNLKFVITEGEKTKNSHARAKNLQKLYSNPELIPGEVKTQIASKIQKKKSELENLYSSPKKTITLEKAQRWAAIQIAKLFLGIPIVPGR